MRLEKHLDKLREQYKAQKEEEETKRQFYHSPETARREGVDGSESSREALDDSVEVSTHSEHTPEPSPGPEQRELPVSSTDGNVASHMVGQRVLPEPAPKPKVAPQVAPRPSGQANVSPPASQPNGGRAGPTTYNPYPPPAQPAPPSPKETNRQPSPRQHGLIHTAPPTSPAQPTTPDKEALFAFAWYHGSIPRDEALRRLEGVGGYDG